MIYDIEVTDTFGGEANYCWVRRYELHDWGGLTDRQLVRRAKALAGYSGVRCDTSDTPDGLEIRPRGRCIVIFVTYREGP